MVSWTVSRSGRVTTLMRAWAEIAPQEAAEVVEVLDADRAIEPVLLPE